MKPGRHVAVSGVLAVGCGMAYDSPLAAAAAFIAGTFIDIDHVLDFRWNDLGRFSPAIFVRACNEYRLERLYLLLHSVEWIVPFVVWTQVGAAPGWIRAAGLGLATHLIMDMIGNGMHMGAYSFIYRAVVGFDARRLVRRLPPAALAYWGSFDAYRHYRREHRKHEGRS